MQTFIYKGASKITKEHREEVTEQELAEVSNGYDDTIRRVNKTKSQAHQKRMKSFIRIKKLFFNALDFPKSVALTALLFAGILLLCLYLTQVYPVI